MATQGGGQQTDYDAPADMAARPTARDDDAPSRPMSVQVVVASGEDSPTARYASWLADTYETQLVRRGETMSIRPETETVVLDRQTLTMVVESARGTVDLRRRGCWVLAPDTVESCDGLIDEYITEPVSREGLLGRVETALRMATYDGTIAELASLTMRRRRLQTRSDTGRVDHSSDITNLSERIDELHHRIDDELPDVESQYAALLGRRHRPSTRQETEHTDT